MNQKWAAKCVSFAREVYHALWATTTAQREFLESTDLSKIIGEGMVGRSPDVVVDGILKG